MSSKRYLSAQNNQCCVNKNSYQTQTLTCEIHLSCSCPAKIGVLIWCPSSTTLSLWLVNIASLARSASSSLFLSTYSVQLAFIILHSLFCCFLRQTTFEEAPSFSSYLLLQRKHSQTPASLFLAWNKRTGVCECFL